VDAWNRALGFAGQLTGLRPIDQWHRHTLAPTNYNIGTRASNGVVTKVQRLAIERWQQKQITKLPDNT